MPKLERLITPAALNALAGASAFTRGEDYFVDGAVERLRRSDELVSAQVMGSEPYYHVELWADGDELGYGCSCPRAADGYFCKHCVAVGLAMLDETIPDPEVGDPDHGRDPESLIRDYLLVQSPEVLTALIMEQAQRDDALHLSLLLKAERASGSMDILRSFRKAIDDATRVRGFVAWDEAGDLASDLDVLVDSLEELLTPGSAAALVELAEYAIEKVDKLLAEDVDDSGGEVGDVLARLGDLHLRACQLARPEPVALAERLFRYETTVSFDSYSDSVRIYQDVQERKGSPAFAHWRSSSGNRSSRWARAIRSIAAISRTGSGSPTSWKRWRRCPATPTRWWR
ncbi:SWIM zinc finger family protein [Methylolobus aquaticus]